MQIGEIGTKSEINGLGRSTHGPPKFLTKTFGPKVRLGRKISVVYGLGGPSFWWGYIGCILGQRSHLEVGRSQKHRGFGTIIIPRLGLNPNCIIISNIKWEFLPWNIPFPFIALWVRAALPHPTNT